MVMYLTYKTLKIYCLGILYFLWQNQGKKIPDSDYLWVTKENIINERDRRLQRNWQYSISSWFVVTMLIFKVVHTHIIYFVWIFIIKLLTKWCAIIKLQHASSLYKCMYTYLCTCPYPWWNWTLKFFFQTLTTEKVFILT